MAGGFFSRACACANTESDRSPQAEAPRKPPGDIQIESVTGDIATVEHPGQDKASIDADRRTLTVDLTTSTSSDQMRVFTLAAAN